MILIFNNYEVGQLETKKIKIQKVILKDKSEERYNLMYV